MIKYPVYMTLWKLDTLVGFFLHMVKRGIHPSQIIPVFFKEEMEKYVDSPGTGYDVLDFDSLPDDRYRDRGMASATDCAIVDLGLVELNEKGEPQRYLYPGLETISGMMADNNGLGDNEGLGGYLKKIPLPFAGLVRLIPDIRKGEQGLAERMTGWFPHFIDVVRVAFDYFAAGGTFPRGERWRSDGESWMLADAFEAFKGDFPDIKEELEIGSRFLTKPESLFSLRGYLVALYALTPEEERESRVRQAHRFWKEAFALGDALGRSVDDRSWDLFRDLVDGEGDHQIFKINAGHGALVLTDLKVGGELCALFSREHLREKAESLLRRHLSDAYRRRFFQNRPDGRNLPGHLRGHFRNPVQVIADLLDAHPEGFKAEVEKRVKDETARHRLGVLADLYADPVSVVVVRHPDGHVPVIMTTHEHPVDLSGVFRTLDGLEPKLWHFESGREEPDGRFPLNFVMNGGGIIVDVEPTALTDHQLIGVIEAGAVPKGETWLKEGALLH